MSKPIQFFIIRFSHKHGHDVWPHFSQKEPSEDDIIKELEDAGTWDGGDEYVEITGPFEVPGGARYPKDWTAA